MTSAALSSLNSPAGGGQRQTQALGGPNATSAVVTQELQKLIAAIAPEQLDRIFGLAEELREEEGAYQAPREIPAHEGRSAGGFD